MKSLLYLKNQNWNLPILLLHALAFFFFYASWQGIRILVLFSWGKNAHCSIVYIRIQFPCPATVCDTHNFCKFHLKVFYMHKQTLKSMWYYTDHNLIGSGWREGSPQLNAVFRWGQRDNTQQSSNQLRDIQHNSGRIYLINLKTIWITRHAVILKDSLLHKP